jgi:hypothetical protein
LIHYWSQPGRFCPCLLTREEVKEYNKIDERLKCTAEWADDSGKICGKPLVAHPRERDLNPPLNWPTNTSIGAFDNRIAALVNGGTQLHGKYYYLNICPVRLFMHAPMHFYCLIVVIFYRVV